MTGPAEGRARALGEEVGGQRVAAAVGERLELSLPENPTTGFRWIVVEDGSPVCALHDAGYLQRHAAPGGGGVHRWTLEVLGPGAGSVALEHRRPWSGGGAPRRLSFVVAAAPATP